MINTKHYYPITNDEQIAIADAFKLIENPDDWRAPIDAIIEEKDLTICISACIFYTSTVLEIVEKLHYGKFLRVKAIGYRSGPAGP